MPFEYRTNNVRMALQTRFLEVFMAPAPKFSPQEQEELILNAAAECIRETSLLDFTMSAVSKVACLSMGSIYKHVQCKEDIIFALASRCYAHHSGIFKQVLTMEELTTPQRIMAISLLCPKKIEVYPFDSHLETFSANELVISRASALWTERMISASESCEANFNKCMHQAAFSGELKLNGNVQQNIEEITFGSWALIVGFQHVSRVMQIRNISNDEAELQQALAVDSMPIRSLKRFLNSFEWKKPLTDEDITHVSNVLIELNLR